MANKSQLYFIGSGYGTSAMLDYFTASDAVIARGSLARAMGRNSHPVVIYANGLDVYADFHGAFPEASIVVVALYWAANVDSGDVAWELCWERNQEAFMLTGPDLDVDSFAPSKSEVDSAPADSGLLRKTQIQFSPSETGGVMPGEPYRLRVRRDAGTFPDTMNGDAQLYRVVLEAAL